ncbi:MAG: Wzz/FepE/Etk N-terminal domain-containing protein [Roseiflexus sp.]|nr:Wzz/FepE/Etk N-terminal domain-containing protein [Roseiflexus sp.]MCS7289797.1 Wzz/FepE/Etk N-terminal domain-containing protein [Roseiflexus sp.]MDW8232488.1 Wzz/FepE/Etk N-terminal domain-containing protein [Roseiflexaceae bacterium]
MDVRFVRRLMRRQWRMIVAGSGFVGLLALIISVLQAPMYQASTTLLVNQNRGLAAPSYESVLMSQQLTRTYAELLKKRPLYETVIANLRLETTPERLMRNVRVSTIRDTQLIVVTAYDRSPQRAADIANELVRLLREQDRQLLTGAYASGERGLSVAEPAQPDPVPASPKVLRNTLLGLIFGLLSMFGIALVREYVDESIKDGAEAERVVGAPVLAGVNARSLARDAQQLVDEGDALSGEAYRMLAVRLRNALADHPARSLMVTSAEPLADTHVVAIRLATVCAQLGQRIVLVDGDLRQPTLHSWFNLQGDAGLRDMLESARYLPVYRYLLPTSVANLMLLPGGKPTTNPLVLFNSRWLGESISELHQHADLIIVAAPALLSASETLILARSIDAALLVIRAEATKSAAAAAARTILDQARIHLLGAVLTGVTDHDIVPLIHAPLLTVVSRHAPGKRMFASLSHSHDAPLPSPPAASSQSSD